MKTALVLLLMPIAAALQSPSSNNELSRRSAVSQLISSSTAAVTSSAASSILLPPSGAYAAGPVDKVTLNSKNKKAFPLASFGLQVYDDETAYKLTLTALEVGYRNFFASVLAGNQKGFARVSYYLLQTSKSTEVEAKAKAPATTSASAPALLCICISNTTFI